MKKTTRRRGRPPGNNAKSAAERMRAYRKRKKAAGLKNVRRWEVADGSGVPRYSDHRILDARSLAMHCMIAHKISQDPELLAKAKNNLARWTADIDGKMPAYFDEWKRILQKPWPEIAELITSMNEDATRLRSSSPFAGILNADERERVYAAFRS